MRRSGPGTRQFQSYHESVKSRRGYKRSIVAVAHKLLRTIHAMLRDRTPYADPGIDYEAISIGRKAARWLRKLETVRIRQARETRENGDPTRHACPTRLTRAVA